MTIDEAIEHIEERACGNDQCAKNHAQLADWLRELRRARMEIELLKTLRDGFKADTQKYKAENANLRKAAEFEHNQLEDIKRAADMMLEEHGVMFAENANLRELVRDMWYEGAFEPGACYVKSVDRLKERTRELGIEANND